MRELGESVLRVPAAPVAHSEFGSTALKALCTDLLDTMRAVNGAGIAAPQIGVSKRVFVVEGKGDNPRYPYKPTIPLTFFVNPEIVVLPKQQSGLTEPQRIGDGRTDGASASEEDDPALISSTSPSCSAGDTISLIEGCLSVPGFRGHVTRFADVIVRAQEPESGAWFAIRCRGHAAGTMQHENDHLNATLFPDLAGPRGLMTSRAFDELHGGPDSTFQDRMRKINERWPVALVQCPPDIHR